MTLEGGSGWVCVLVTPHMGWTGGKGCNNQGGPERVCVLVTPHKGGPEAEQQ